MYIYIYIFIYRYLICEIYYGDDNSVNCYQIANHDIEDIVQQHSAEWTLFSVVAYLIPALFSDTILGAYGDRYGRKLNILLGLAGIALSEYGYLLTLSSAATPYWTTLIFGAVSGMTGYIAMIPVSCNAYLADTTEDTDLLTIKSGIFSAFQTFGSVAGGFLAAGFADYIRIPAAIDFELLLFLIAFLYTLWRIPQKPGLQEIDRRAQVQAVRAVTYSNNDRKSSVQNMKNFFNELMNLLKSGFITYTKKRPGHRRAFIFIAVLVLMLNYTTSVETRTSGLINSFVFRRTDEGSLAWTTEELGYWNGSGYLMLLFGTLSGLLLFKKVLKLRETTIILIGLLSSTIRTIIIGYSSNDWMMYLANAVGLFAGLIQPAVVSFLTQVFFG
uniref:MFS domain-containing protein n=1 Tax=Heterorhabditis bacteriophora TaxID=37862 RepID=A0A1I7WJ91_HETBA